MKSKAEKLIELFGRADSIDLCESFDDCDYKCEICPFDSPEALKETIKELKELNDRY